MRIFDQNPWTDADSNSRIRTPGLRLCEISTSGTTVENASLITMPPSSIVGGEHCVFGSSVRLSVLPLTLISRDAISLRLMEEFQWNLAQIFSMWVGIADKLFKVRGQRSRSYRGRMHFPGYQLIRPTVRSASGGGIHRSTVWRRGWLAFIMILDETRISSSAEQTSIKNSHNLMSCMLIELLIYCVQDVKKQCWNTLADIGATNEVCQVVTT